jgi:hypothetical protein
MNLNLTKALFLAKETIKVSGASEKKTNTLGPRGIGKGPSRPSTADGAAKFNGAARVLDYILADKAVAVAETADGSSLYGEVTVDSVVNRFIVSEKGIVYEAEAMTDGYTQIIPSVLYYIEKHEHLRKLFQTAAKEYNDTGYVTIQTLLSFCDEFYYGVATRAPEISIDESTLSIETVQRAYESSLLTPSKLFQDVGMPAFTAFTVSGVSGVAASAKKSLLESAINGELIIPYQWDDKQKNMIERNKVLDAFISSEAFEDVLSYVHGSLQEIMMRLDSGIEGAAAIRDDVLNLTLFGDPSGGKTTLANALGEALGLPVYTVSQSKYTEEDTYWGKTTATENGFTNVPTPFLEAFTNGGIAVLEEINLVDPGVTMGALGNAIWSPFILMKDGHKPVQRHPLCVIISTKNIGTYGSRDVNQALNNRFMQTFEIEEPTKEEFVKFLMLHDNNAARCKWVYDAYHRITTYLKDPSINADEILKNISFRSCLGVLKGIKYGQSPKRAVKNSIVNKISEADVTLGHTIYDDIVLSMPEIR